MANIGSGQEHRAVAKPVVRRLVENFLSPSDEDLALCGLQILDNEGNIFKKPEVGSLNEQGEPVTEMEIKAYNELYKQKQRQITECAR